MTLNGPHRLATVKSHKAAVVAKDREVIACKAALTQWEVQLAFLLSEKDHEISRLRGLSVSLTPA
jgi:hypothetical protein